MILKALYDYYYRLGNLPAPGTEAKEIEFVIVIDKEGKFICFESKRIDKKRCVSYMVPKAVGRTSGVKPNLLWDNGKYVLRLKEPQTAHNESFAEKIFEIARLNPQNQSVRALEMFYLAPIEGVLDCISKDPLFLTVTSNLSSNIAFQIEGEKSLIAEDRTIILPPSEDNDGVTNGLCLITGEKGPIVRLTSATPLPGNSPTASLVSMMTNKGYDSYGKIQSFNAPISTEAEFAYTSALKYLLGKDSHNKYKIGERTILFWGKGNESIVDDVIDSFWTFTNIDSDKKDNPNEKLGKVEKIFKGIWSGEIKTTLDDRFYILGLAPYTGRIAVVSWSEMPVKEFSQRILEHFEDMEIIDLRNSDKRRPYKGIYSILSSVALNGKISDIPSPIIEGTVNAIVNGGNYPFGLFSSALDRVKVELLKYSLSIGYAAILKAYINRFNKHNNVKKLAIMLDKTNDNPGYVCGRLAAVLEHIQTAIKGGDTIRTTYLTAASATPATVFPSMLSLSNHHSEKLDNERLRVYYERIKQEIISLLPPDGFPARLDMMDQGRFFVGYYHQRADLFTKKDTE